MEPTLTRRRGGSRAYSGVSSITTATKRSRISLFLRFVFGAAVKDDMLLQIYLGINLRFHSHYFLYSMGLVYPETRNHSLVSWYVSFVR
jgi:hypothetical protein